jgi:glucan phosphoethanolaminetransferase (alkaline phosphatase superfamily)
MNSIGNVEAGKNKPNRLGTILLVVTIVVVLLPNFVWLATSDRLYFTHSIPFMVMSAILPSLIVVLGLFAALGRWPWLAVLVCLPFLIVVPIESAYITQYGEPTYFAIVATIFESNSRETIDFLGALLWPLAAATLVCLVLGIVTTIHLYRTQYRWTHRSRIWTLTACVTALLMPSLAALINPAPVAGGAASGAMSSAAQTSAAATEQGAGLPVWMQKIEPSFPAGVAVRLYHYRLEWAAMRRSAERLREFHFQARQANEIPGRQVYVLVIGETGRRDRWQLYGYGRDTNPELAALPNTIKLADVVSPWSASRMAVPIIVTRKRGTDARSQFDERSVMDAFAEAGFATYWMSNQLAVGEFDSPIAVVAHDAEHVSFYNVADWGKPGNYDEVLLTPLKAALAGNEQKLFIVLHTLGSHANYAYRYPPAFDRFIPSLKDVADPDYYNFANAERIYNSYDNSVLYTDHFVAEVARTLAQANVVSTMWYVADHGEDLITQDCKFAGHGNGTVHDFPVPSVFWYSDAYAHQFGKELEQLRNHAGEKLSTENVFESLIDMARIDFPSHDRSWSLFSAQWQSHERIVHAMFDVDFDSADRSQKCQMLWPHER